MRGLLAAGAVAMAACTVPSAPQAASVSDAPRPSADAGSPRGRVVARVNGQPIHEDDVRPRGLLAAQGDKELQRLAMERFVENAVDRLLVLGEARRRGVTLTEAEIRALRAAEPAPADLSRMLQDLQKSPEAWRAEQEDIALMVKTRQVAAKDAFEQPTEAQIAAEYAAQPALYRHHPTARVRLLALEPPAAADADELLRALRARPSSFAAQARKRSAHPSRAQGGDLGWVELGYGPPPSLADLPRPVWSAISSTPAGEVKGPVRTDSGVFIVRVEAIRPAKPPTLQAARPRIVEMLLDRRRVEAEQRWLESLKKQARIERRP